MGEARRRREAAEKATAAGAETVIDGQTLAEMGGFLEGRRPFGGDSARAEFSAADERVERLLRGATMGANGYFIAPLDGQLPRLDGHRKMLHVGLDGGETTVAEAEVAWHLLKERLAEELEEAYRRDPGRTRRWHMKRIARREGLKLASRRVRVTGGGVTVTTLGRTAAEAREILMQRLAEAGFAGAEIGLPLASERVEDGL